MCVMPLSIADIYGLRHQPEASIHSSNIFGLYHEKRAFQQLFAQSRWLKSKRDYFILRRLLSWKASGEEIMLDDRWIPHAGGKTLLSCILV